MNDRTSAFHEQSIFAASRKAARSGTVNLRQRHNQFFTFRECRRAQLAARRRAFLRLQHADNRRNSVFRRCCAQFTTNHWRAKISELNGWLCEIAFAIFWLVAFINDASTFCLRVQASSSVFPLCIGNFCSALFYKPPDSRQYNFIREPTPLRFANGANQQ